MQLSPSHFLLTYDASLDRLYPYNVLVYRLELGRVILTECRQLAGQVSRQLLRGTSQLIPKDLDNTVVALVKLHRHAGFLLSTEPLVFSLRLLEEGHHQGELRLIHIYIHVCLTLTSYFSW